MCVWNELVFLWDEEEGWVGKMINLAGSMLGFLAEGLMSFLLMRSTAEPRMPAPNEGLRTVGESGADMACLMGKVPMRNEWQSRSGFII